MRRILLVEDELEFRLTTQLMLELEGFQVDCAEDGAAAVEMASQHQYDCILMDIGLPKLDGIKACKAIKQDQAQNNRSYLTPIVAMTESTQMKQLDNCIDAGMTKILFKPVKLLLLQRLIRSLSVEECITSLSVRTTQPIFRRVKLHNTLDRYHRSTSKKITSETISARICEPVVSQKGYEVNTESQDELKTMELPPFFMGHNH